MSPRIEEDTKENWINKCRGVISGNQYRRIGFNAFPIMEEYFPEQEPVNHMKNGMQYPV